MIAEINLLGTGGGYGESIVANLGNDKWIVVDSCQNPLTKDCLPLKYLLDNGIDVEKVILVVCTHWHNDHIKGLSNLLDHCTNADFSFARANDYRKFLRLVSLDNQKGTSNDSNSSTIEFNRCLDIISDRQKRPKYCTNDQLLFSESVKDKEIKIFSLSPSNLSNQLYDDEISRLLSDFCEDNKRIPKLTPNDRSVVLLLELGHHTIILGADMEVNNNIELGWLDITRNSQVINTSKKASYFKIPHHGSENGYHDEIWSKLFQKNPIGTLTPYNRGSKLPQEEMIEKYSSITEELHITSLRTLSSKPKNRNSGVTKTIKRFSRKIREIKFEYGLVSSKINILDGKDRWITSCEGEAKLLNK